MDVAATRHQRDRGQHHNNAHIELRNPLAGKSRCALTRTKNDAIARAVPQTAILPVISSLALKLGLADARVEEAGATQAIFLGDGTLEETSAGRGARS